MVVLERPDRLLLLHQLDPSGPAAGYNPVHVFSPTHLRTPSPVPRDFPTKPDFFRLVTATGTYRPLRHHARFVPHSRPGTGVNIFNSFL